MKVLVDWLNAPQRKTIGSCGYDLYCPKDVILTKEPVTLDMGVLLQAGDIPDGCFGLLVPRSSIGAKKGVHMRNTIGIIDSSYTMDTIKATLYTDSKDPVELKFNERILQLIIVPYVTMPDEIAPTEERTGGYGSTGL